MPPWPATSAAAAPTPASAPRWPMPPRPWPEGAPAMLPTHIDSTELPRILQRLMAEASQQQPEDTAALPRRSFLKLAGVGGLALGAFPHMAMAQATGKQAAASTL